jgi:hypothetical protein
VVGTNGKVFVKGKRRHASDWRFRRLQVYGTTLAHPIHTGSRAGLTRHASNERVYIHD